MVTTARRGVVLRRALAAGLLSVVVMSTLAGAANGFSFTAGDASVVVSWSGSVNGAATLTASVDAATGCTASVSSTGSASCVITGLVNGDAYTVSASVASNGKAVDSSSATVTPYTRPGPVSAITAIPGDTQALVSWTPGYSGGASVSYTATATSTGGTQSCATTTSNCEITGLGNGVTYSVSVTSRNAAGTAVAGGVSVIPRTTPGVVTGIVVTRNASDEPVLTWTPPSDNGGSVVTGYEVLNETSSSGVVLATTTSTSVTLTGVGNGSGMTFVVVAFNAAGSSVASSSVTLGAPTVSAKTSAISVRRSGQSTATITVYVRDINQIGLGGVSVIISTHGAKMRSWSRTSDAGGVVTQRVTGLSGSVMFSASASDVVLGQVTLMFSTAGTGTTSTTVASTTSTQSTGTTIASTTSTLPTSTTSVPPTTVASTLPTTSTTMTNTTTTNTTTKHEQVHISFGAGAGLQLSRYHVAVTGQGFAPGTLVVVVVHSAPRQLGTVVVDASGDFHIPVQLNNLATGLHHLIVTAYQGRAVVARAKYAFSVRQGVLVSLGTSGLGQYAPYVPAREKSRTLEAALGVLVGLATLRSVTRRRVGVLEDAELERYGEGEEAENREARGWLARLSQTGPGRVARISPVMGRVLSDGEYLRGLVGWGWAGLLTLSLAAGITAGWSAHFTVVPVWGWFAVILVLGVLDATLGYVAGVAFVTSAALAGHLMGANEVRLVMGLILVWFAVPLGAASVAALRRRITKRAEDVADRLGDLVVGGMFGAWLAVKMSAALSVLAGVNLPLSHDGGGVIVVVVVALSVRVGLETWAAHGERFATMIHIGELESSRTQMTISLAVQMAAFWFVSAGVLGASWTLGIGEVVFFTPLVAWLWIDHIPKSAWLGRHAARGVLKWSIVIGGGAVLASVLGHGPVSVQLGFVLLPLPILAFWTLELFEDDEAVGPALTWRRRAVGLVLVALCAGLVLGV